MSTSTEQEPTPASVPPTRRKRPSRLVLVCLAIAVVILLGGSLFGILWKRGNGTSGGAQAAASPTPTATPTWMPTAVTPPPNSLFYDTFQNNSHGWSLASNDGYYRILVNNSLILANTNPNTPMIESVPTSTNLTDYMISADFTINRGDAHDSVGLYLRGDSTLDHDYRIDINGNKTLDVVKEWLDPQATQPDQETMLRNPIHTSLLNPLGQSNTLSVTLLGPKLTIVLNNETLFTLIDSSYTSGQAALFVRHGSSSSGVNVSFSRVEIDSLATPTPTPATK